MKSSNKTVFANRFDKKYHEDVMASLTCLDYDAEELAIPVISNGRSYSKKATIFYSGVSASLLLDFDGDYQLDGKVAANFKDLLENINSLNKKGVFLEIKFLFAYQYSDFAFQLMTAGQSEGIWTSNEKGEYAPNFSYLEMLDYGQLGGSKFVANQRRALRNLQRFYFNKLPDPNRLEIRLTPIPLNLSGLIINESCYYDVYSYAKKSSESSRLASELPLIKLNKQTEKDEFKCLADNFNYLWNHQTVLFIEDVAEYTDGNGYSFINIKTPEKIQFKKKLEWLKELYTEKNKKSPTSEEVRKWHLNLEEVIIRSTRVIKHKEPHEAIFIACSWDKSNNVDYRANTHASELKKLITDAFRDDKGNATIKINLVAGDAGGQLYDRIYSYMDSSSHAIILFTNDNISDGKKNFSRPNVSHELGYMTHKLNARQSKRVLIVRDEEVEIPSNVKVYDQTEVNLEKFCLSFHVILSWIKSEFISISPEQLKKGGDYFKEVLNQKKENGYINDGELGTIVKLIDEICLMQD
jgi:hypothetical protein